MKPRSCAVLLVLAGAPLSVIGALGLASTLWLGGLHPSDWFIISRSGTTIEGWAITAGFTGTTIVGACLLVAGRRRRRMT